MRVTIRSAAFAAAALFVFVGAAIAGHWAADGWSDRHVGYPAVPNGLAQINSTFGNRCTADSNFNRYTWTAWDNGVAYNVNFHKKLGGAGVPGWEPSTGGTSSNLFWDVRGHISNEHHYDTVKHGIYGYNCRQIAGTTKWSTHAWGIAIDMNSAFEHLGHAHNHTMDADVVRIYETHRWTWGLAFQDAMHFQYATGY